MKPTQETHYGPSGKKGGFTLLHPQFLPWHERRYSNYPVPDNGSHDFMTLINRNYVYEFANNSYCRVLGKPFNDVVNNTVARIWGSEIFDTVMKECLDKCFAGKVIHYEGWLDVTESGRKYYRMVYHPYADEQGKITHASVALWDMTERKMEEEFLQKCGPHFTESMKKMFVCLFCCDMEGRFIFVNDTMVEHTGYTREWFAERTLFDFIRPHDKEKVSLHMDSSVRGRESEEFEFSYVRGNGTVAWVRALVTPLWEKGRVGSILGVLTDITKQKEYERTIHELEQKYTLLFNECMDAVCITDITGKVITANKSFLKLFGYTADAVRDVNFVEDLFIIRDDGIACLDLIKKKGGITQYEIQARAHNGKTIYCQMTATSQYGHTGAIEAYLWIIRDVTPLKETEKALHDTNAILRSVVYESPIPQFVIDTEHRVVYWNRALEAVSGISSKEMVGTKEHWKAFYDYERPCMADLIVDNAEHEINKWYKVNERKSNIPGFHKAMDFFKTFGTDGKWLYFTATPIKDSEGKIVGALETLEDITEYKRIEDAIHLAEEKCLGILKAVARGV